MRFAILLGAIIAVLALALPAAAKEGVRATLLTPFPGDAAAGDRIGVSWRLRYATDDRPFGANGVFVRLPSATGAPAETGFAPTGSYTNGEYTASVRVPEGWIGGVEIGLRGFTSGAGGSRTGDLLFPVTNVPPLRPAVEARASTESSSWPFALAGGLLWLLAVPVIAVRRRR